MAKHGIKGIIGGGAAPGGAAGQVVEAWQKTLANHGKETELGGDLIMGVSFHIAETEQKAIDQARAYFEENMKMFAPLGFVRGLSDEQISAMGDPARAPMAGLPTLEQAVESGSWLCGPPDLIAEKLMRIQEMYPGLEEVNMGNVIGTPQGSHTGATGLVRPRRDARVQDASGGPRPGGRLGAGPSEKSPPPKSGGWGWPSLNLCQFTRRR